MTSIAIFHMLSLISACGLTCTMVYDQFDDLNDEYSEHTAVDFVQAWHSPCLDVPLPLRTNYSKFFSSAPTLITSGTAVSVGLTSVFLGICSLCCYSAALHVRTRLRESAAQQYATQDGFPIARSGTSFVIMNQPSTTPAFQSRQHTRPSSAERATPSQSYLEAPPPICPNLVMPRMEARFHINLDEVMGWPDVYDIVGMSGRPLMKMKLAEVTGNSFRFMLVSIGMDDPRITIVAPSPDDTPEESCRRTLPPMIVHGRGQQFYGTLVMNENEPSCSLNVGSQTVLKVVITDTLQMITEAYAQNGSQVARTHCLTMQQRDSMGRHGGHLWVVKPKIDAVLVVSCMLTLTLRMQQSGTLG